MKKARMAICLAIVVLVAVYTKASTVEIISEQYRVWGNYKCFLDVGGNPNDFVADSYDNSSPSPVSDSVRYNEYCYSLSSSDLLSISASACSRRVMSARESGRAGSHASGDWLFIPQTGYNTLKLQIDFEHLYSSADIVEVLLEDVTSESQIFYIKQQAMGFYNMIEPFGHGPYITTFTVDPTHQYRAYLSLAASSDGDGLWYGSVQVMALPEPVSLLLLGLGGLLVRKKRLHSN
jgi:hypothetical protein